MSSNEILASSLQHTRMDVDRIQHYSRNPRRQRNPEYDRIKASIRSGGIDQPLVISQPPSTDIYVLHSGGNTRLTILKELLRETGDDRFRWVPCFVTPWSQESNVLFAHLRENELRGGLPFIDKALAVLEAKTLLEQEMQQALTQRQLEELFQERGFNISHSLISKMTYTVEVLWPAMPMALTAGLGRPQVEKIRALHRAASQVWQRRDPSPDIEFGDIFSEWCRRLDGEEWDIQALRDALEHELAVELDLNPLAAHLEVEACLAGREYTYEQLPTDIDEREGWVESGEAKVESEDSIAFVDDDIFPEVERAEAEFQAELGFVNKLRDRLWKCASLLASAHGLDGVVKQTPQEGLGFLVIDVMPTELTDALDQDTQDLVCGVWWQLAASSELTAAPAETIQRHVNPGCPLHQALVTRDMQLLFETVWTSDPGWLSSRVWSLLSPMDWKTLTELMAVYRSIKRLASEAGIDLW